MGLLNYNDVKKSLDASVAETGGKYKPFDLAFYSAVANNAGINTPIYSNGQLVYVPLTDYNGDPLQHYVEYGAEQGFRPNAWFDPVWYRQKYADTQVLSGADLLVHYSKFGANEGRAPSQLLSQFDGTRYLADNPDVATYVNANLGQFLGSTTNGAIAHYVKFGALEARQGFDIAGQLIPFSVFPTTATITPSAAANGAISLALNNNEISGVDKTTLTGSKVVADGASASTLRVTGTADIRVDFTNNANQVTGIDLNGDETISSNGVENNVSGAGVFTAKNFVTVDAYARNAFSTLDRANNFTGDIRYDGSGYGGDGTSTDGNIFLGGMGNDTAYGGIGNDFMAGGGTLAGGGQDTVNAGRNADFVFVELSALSPADGNNLIADGGETADNVNGTQNALVDATGATNDRDWILFEGSDDNEPVTITLTDQAASATVAEVTNRYGGAVASADAFEAVDASGNLYGFLNDVAVELGSRATDSRQPDPVRGTENYGAGSTAQIIVAGSASANIVVGGYDNDIVTGGAGNDVIFGGNLDYLLRNKNNKNLVDANNGLSLNVNLANTVSDGRDNLQGGTDNDAIVFEAASGAVAGDGGFDTLYITTESTGRVAGTALTAEYTDSAAEAAALAALTTDKVMRFDLDNANGGQNRDYGGANRGLGVAPTETATADQTNYVSALGSKPATTVATVDGLIATGLGDIDYKAAGSNSPELKFSNQQNYQGSVSKFDVRGVNSDAASTTKFGSYWTDSNFGQDTANGNLDNLDNGVGSASVAFRDVGDNVIYTSIANDTLEGRVGDDELGGGKGDDNFIFDFGDSTDIVRRQTDANGDNLWDTDASGNRLYSQDFRADPTGVTATRLQIDFGTTDLTSPNVAVSNVFLTIEPGKTGAINLVANNLQSAKSITALAAAVETAYKAIDSSITVTASGNSLIVSDAKGRDISDTTAEGYAVFVAVGNASASTTATLNPGGAVVQENDRVLFVDYLDRVNNSWVDNTTNELRNQAQDLVVGTGSSTTLANTQEWRVQFQNLAEGDKVDLNVNGTIISRTVAAGESTDAFVTALANQINNQTLDIYTAAGSLAAATNDVNAGNTREQVLVLTQNAIGTGENKVFMSAPTATITAVNGSASSASWQIANTSGTSIDLYNFDGRDGNINAADVLFLGRSGQTTMATTDSTATLQFAKNAGETITGKDASVVLIPRTSGGVVSVTNLGNNAQATTNPAAVLATTLYHAVNGDDQLIGGTGNDTLNGGTGDDRFILSKGTDVIDGGANTTAPNAEVIKYVDSILAQEADFGSGTKFTITLDSSLDASGKGTIVAVDSKGANLGTTSFTNVEEIRTASNTAQDTIDFSGLSNSVATATTTSANLDAGVLVIPTVAATNYNEGVLLNLTQTNAGLAWAADRNGDNDTQDAGEIGSNPVAVFGVENVIGGSANDIVAMDKTQAGSANNINLAGEQADLTPGPNTYTEGRDMVTYDHSGLATVTDRPTITVQAEAASNTDNVFMTGGAVGTVNIQDTLTGVEVIDVAAGATNRTSTDTLDLSKIAGATVSFGNANVTVGRTLGGLNKADSVANVEANTLEAGGISLSSANLGNELLEVVGITQLERVTGSTGDDRVVVGDGTLFTNTSFNGGNGAAQFDDQKIGFNFFNNYSTATRTYTTTGVIDNKFLYQFDLGAGSNDAMDYRQSADAIAVVVDFAGTNGDYVAIDQDAAGFFADGTTDRVDVVKNAERFYANSLVGANSRIDLSQATEAVTVTFGAEAKELGNEVKDPNGTETVVDASKTQDNQVTGINVSTATNTSVARFMQSSVQGDGTDAISPNAAALWEIVEGSNQNDTIKLSQYQDRTAVETFNLRGGVNVVDYSAAVKVGQNDAYTLAISDLAPVVSSTNVHAGNTVSHTSTDAVPAVVDTISIDRQLDSKNGNLDGALTVIGSSNSNDTVSIAAFALPTGLALAGANNDLTGAKKDGTAVSEDAFVRDVTDTVKGGYNLVDLGSGLGVTTGQVIQDFNLGFKGQNALADHVLTSISGWENITGSANNDRMYGNDNNNTITGGGGTDVFVGRGGGDTLNMGAGVDRVVYNGPGDTADTVGGTNKAAAGEYDTVNNFDDAGADRLLIDLTTTAANGGFNLTANLVQEVDFSAATAVAANGGVIIQQLDAQRVATNADLLDMTSVAAKLNFGGSSFSTTVADGVQSLFVVESAGGDSAIYVWQQADTGTELVNAVVDAAELRLLSYLTGEAVAKFAGEAVNVFTVADLGVRQTARATGVADTVLSNDNVRDEIVYTALNQSQYGQIDTIGKFAAGVVANGFEVGVDKIDLSSFNLGAADGLALNGIVIRGRNGAGSQITDANANDFFYDGNNIRRAVVVEYDNDDIDAGTAGTQARARVFVDLNGNGQLDTTADLFIDFATNGTGAVVDGLMTTGSGTAGSFVPGYDDFIFMV